MESAATMPTWKDGLCTTTTTVTSTRTAGNGDILLGIHTTVHGPNLGHLALGTRTAGNGDTLLGIHTTVHEYI